MGPSHTSVQFPSRVKRATTLQRGAFDQRLVEGCEVPDGV